MEGDLEEEEQVSVLQERSLEVEMSCGGRQRTAGGTGAQTQQSCPAFHFTAPPVYGWSL